MKEILSGICIGIYAFFVIMLAAVVVACGFFVALVGSFSVIIAIPGFTLLPKESQIIILLGVSGCVITEGIWLLRQLRSKNTYNNFLNKEENES